MTPVGALTWEIFARYRRVVAATALYLLALCLVVPLLPEDVNRKNLVFPLLLPVLLGACCLLPSLLYGEGEHLEAAQSTLPRRLLLLPVSAAVLALVPLTIALVLFPSAWAVLAVGVLRPSGFAAPLAWPGLLVAVLLGWMAAWCWTPMPSAGIRLTVLGLGGLAVAVGLIWALGEGGFGEPGLLAVLGGSWPPAAALAVAGARRARGAGIPERGPAAGENRPTSPDAVAPLGSPRQALRWLLWRLHGRPALYLSLCYLVPVLPLAAATEYVLRTRPFLFEAAVTNPTLHRLGPAWVAFGCLLVVPLMVALAGGGGAALFDPRRARAGLPAFVAVRPVTNEDLLRPLFASAARHLLVMWGVTLAGAAAGVLLAGHAGDMADRLAEVCGSPGLAVGVFLGLLAGVYVGTGLFYLGSMWSGLFGSNAGGVIPVVLHSLVLCAVVGLGVNGQPDWLPWVQAGLCLALALKLLAAAWLARLNLRRRLVRPATLLGGLALWAALVAALAAGAGALGGATAALAVVVLIPLAQALLAPVALYRGRHGAWA